MWGKKQISAVVLAVILGVTAGVSHSTVYAEPNSSGNNQAEDASKDDSKKEEKKEEDMTPEELEKKAEEDAYKMEIQSNGWKNWPQGPGTYGEAAIVMDAGTGSILYAKNIDGHEYPASITKVLTSLIALKYGNLSDNVTFSNDCVSFMQPGDSSVGLKEGNVITLEQALYATLLASANEAAYAVAENVGKNAGHDYSWFIQQMNEECKSLGGNNSNFVNANGLHDENHYTCARDMALIGREIWRYPEFLKICQEQSYTIPASDTTEEHVFPQHHKMLIKENKNYYQYAVAGKTGYTSNALSTLITLADNGNMKLVCVVLRTHGVNIYPDTKNLFEYVFNNFQKIQVADEKKPDEVEEFISAAESQSENAESSQTGGSGNTESVQAGGSDSAESVQTGGSDSAESVQTGGNDSTESSQTGGSDSAESVQTGGNEYQPLEDGYVILPKDVSYKDVDYEITDVDENSGEGTIQYTYDGHQVGSATAKLTKKYLQKISTGKENVDSTKKSVDNSGTKKKNGGKLSAKNIWKNFLNKAKAAWAFGQKKFAGKTSTEKYMIAGGCLALVILIFSLIVVLIRRRR